MQTWQLFIILKQPVPFSVTAFSNLTKLTNYLFTFYAIATKPIVGQKKSEAKNSHQNYKWHKEVRGGVPKDISLEIK